MRIDAKTQEVDLELFQKLGLKTFQTDNRSKFFVGEYKLALCKRAKVRVSVTCLPAQFWEFEVETEEGYKCIINTGRGPLSKYWGSVIKVANGSFLVNAI